MVVALRRPAPFRVLASQAHPMSEAELERAAEARTLERLDAYFASRTHTDPRPIRGIPSTNRTPLRDRMLAREE